jgi:multimeric flavodoxin WrbA
MNRWPFEGTPLKDKIGAAFVSAGGISAGEELTQLSILHSMLIFGMIVVGGRSGSLRLVQQRLLTKSRSEKCKRRKG